MKVNFEFEIIRTHLREDVSKDNGTLVYELELTKEQLESLNADDNIGSIEFNVRPIVKKK